MCSNLTLQETTVYEHFPRPGPAVGTLGSQALPEGVISRKRGPGDSTGTQSRVPSKTGVFLKVRNSYVFHKSEAESGGGGTQRPLLPTTGPRCCCWHVAQNSGNPSLVQLLIFMTILQRCLWGGRFQPISDFLSGHLDMATKLFFLESCPHHPQGKNTEA